MRLWINDFSINDWANRTWLNNGDIEGLDIPSISTSKGKNTGQHGGYVGAQTFGPRAVSIPGSIFASDVSEAVAKRRELQSHLHIHPDVNHVRIEDDDGSMYAFDAYLMDFSMPISRSRRRAFFKIELEAPNPVIYDNAAGAALVSYINQVIPGGFQFTTTSPQFGSSFYFSAGSDSTTIENTSEVPSYPVIKITGKITNPEFINRTTGESFKLQGYSVDASAVTVIDMGERIVTLNGGNAFAYASPDSDWWPLVPGENRIEFVSGAGGDVTTAEISWRPGYWGI